MVILTRIILSVPKYTKCAREVALRLLEIFTIIGAQAIWQMDNGREFVAHVITVLKLIWPGILIAHGKPRHQHSQGSIERANDDLMLGLWMHDNSWALGLTFVQMQKNSYFYSTNKWTPHMASFGKEMKCELNSILVPKEIMEKLID